MNESDYAIIGMRLILWRLVTPDIYGRGLSGMGRSRVPGLLIRTQWEMERDGKYVDHQGGN